MVADDFATGYHEGFTADEVLALARVFNDPLGAAQLLDRVGFERSDHPRSASTSRRYWDQVDAALRDGALDDGRRKILRAAREQYPANPVFREPPRGQPAEPPANSPVERASRSERDAPPGPQTPPPGGWFRPRDGEQEHVTVLALDAVGYSQRGMLVQVAVQDGIREVVDRALARAGIPTAAAETQDHGDGYLGAVSSAIPKAMVVADFTRELAVALRDYNRTRGELGQIRLRLALHQGEVIRTSGGGWAGDAAVVGARLVDAPPLRDALAGHPDAELALIVSSELFDSTVRESLRGLDPEAFDKVEVRMPKFKGTAWLLAPGRRRGADRTRSGTARELGGGRGDDRAEAIQWDFFVSAAREDEENWGSWITWYLKEEDYRVRLDTVDVQAGAFEPDALDRAIRLSRRTIVVLSSAYLRSDKVRAAWLHAWRRDPLGLGRTLIPVRVEDCEPEGLLGGIRYIDLVGLDETQARQTLKASIRGSIEGRTRPSDPPPFPGGERR